MSIVLVEVDATESKPERTFSKAVVRVGREAGECDLAFDKARYPMVSRRHAEFRCEDGRWMLADLGSTYGVFVNGERISGAVPIGVGNKVQFGQDGPTVVVIWFEASKEGSPPAVPPGVGQASAPEPPSQSPPIVQRPPADIPAKESWEVTPAATPSPPPESPDPSMPIRASLVFADDPKRPPFAFTAAVIWIGRDQGCDVVIDGQAGMVSRRHASIKRHGKGLILEDNKSFNGTLVNEHRISAPTPIFHGDKVRLGAGGPVLRLEAPDLAPAKAENDLSVQRSAPAARFGRGDAPGSSTIAMDREGAARLMTPESASQPQLVISVAFGDKNVLTVGRREENDIRLDGLQISNKHARFVRSTSGVAVEDLRSTNGVFVNGQRVTRQEVGPNDSVQIGAFVIGVDSNGNVNVFDTRARTRLDVAGVSLEVRNGSGGRLTLLDDISLSIQPNEFVGVLGPSGAGKSLLMEVMNGSRAAAGGRVLLNDRDLHRNIQSLKQFIGYVPQDDIIHRELTVRRTLTYAARMRLARDASASEIRQIVDEVLDVTGLSERRDVRVDKLSGGQRKRVSIAVELITKPSIVFLDEPTSGLDPAAEERIMKLFRRIAESGRTVVMTTHAMENVKLFDKIVVLMGGKLVFCGRPDEALVYLKATSFKDLYSRLEEPVETAVRTHGEAHRKQLTERTAAEWSTRFRSTPQYAEHIQKPLAEAGKSSSWDGQRKRRLGFFGSIRQWMTLSQRYFEVLLKDKLTLLILFAQAPVIALMTFVVVGRNQPRDFLYFVLALVAVWFGTSVSAREIVRERPIYRRERMVNLGLLPYLASKLFVIGVIVTLQCLMLFVPLKILDVAGLMPMPGELLGIPQMWAMLLTAAVGIGVGLFVSAVVRTSEMATGLVPLILIPQILFSGIVGVPNGVIDKAVSLTMPAAWSFDTMKRFSTLDTLEEEGANPKGRTRGLGLYKFIEAENEKIVSKARQDFEDLRRLNENSYQESPVELPAGLDPASVNIKKIPEDLSAYVTFLHPWMNEVLNQLVLMLMFVMLVLATLVVLRLKDG